MLGCKTGKSGRCKHRSLTDQIYYHQSRLDLLDENVKKSIRKVDTLKTAIAGTEYDINAYKLMEVDRMFQNFGSSDDAGTRFVPSKAQDNINRPI